ncbi:RNA polymerase sigma-70 factor [Tumebacillus sp. ITR2]|uniref:RNA polymerase sigma-70 factor n=1 Tax=Tumebacillus amylolyticus TaxID=2801339 RepID=A0ABS1J9M9_9BACL|nr:RNA polymerase sigma-70 factor [Tumebacillus amylolyticus]
MLFSLAYRLLGTVMDAEDMVQETFVAYAGLGEAQEIHNQRAYLCKMLTNRCLDFLRSAKHRREVYVGPWLPEPVVWREDRGDHDPMRELLCRDDLTMAYLLMMETLTPTERAVFVLREAYQYEYAEIANLVGKSETNCRKIHSRVKQKLHPEVADRHVEYAKDQAVLNRFVTAFTTGDTGTLMELLSDDVTLLSDGGGKAVAAIHPIVSSARVLVFLQGIVRNAPSGSAIDPVTINGQPGLLFKAGDEVVGTFSFDREGERIGRIFMVRNPDKLARIGS